MAINTSTNKFRVITTTVSGLTSNSKFSDIKTPALVVNTSEGGVFYTDGSKSTLTQVAALPNHNHDSSYLSLSGGKMSGSINFKSGYSLKVTDNNNSEQHILYLDPTSQNLLIGYQTGINGKHATSIYGNNIYLKSKGSSDTTMYLNNSGNVTIGASDLAGTSNKLHVDGNVKATKFIGDVSGNATYATSSSTTNALNGLGANSESGATRAISSLMCLDTQQAQSAVPWGTGYNNAILSISRYSTSKYTSQLGFSATDLYVRHFNNEEVNKDKTWDKVLTSSNYTSYCSSLGHSHGDYLPKTGGTLTSAGVTTLNLRDTARNESGISYAGNGGAQWFVGKGVGVASGAEHFGFYNGTKGLVANFDINGNFTATKFIGPLQGTADTATLLKPNAGITTDVASWNPLTSFTKCWGQKFTSTSLSSDTGDILYYLRRGDSGYGTSTTTELCVCIDGDFYGKGGGGTPQKVSYEGHTHTQLPELHINKSYFSLSNSGTFWIGVDTDGQLYRTNNGWTASYRILDSNNYTAYCASTGHTHSYVPIKSVTFTPAETAIGPADVLSKLGSGYALGKGSWDYAGNGYISKDTTGSIAIDLAGCSVIQLGSESAYTQLYITAPASTTTNSKTNEILFYNNHGSSYSPAWTRVLTNRNYSEYCLPTTGATHSGAFTIKSGGDLILKASSSATNDPGDLAFYNNSGSELARIYYSSSKMLMRYGSSATSYEILTTNTGAAKSHSHAIGDLPTHTFSSTQALGWSSTIGTSKIPTINTIAYWNGAHSGTSSNLQYCDRGRFGTIVTKNEGDYATSGHTHSGLVGDIISFTKSLNVTTSWQDTGISGADLSSGTYIIQLYANLAGTASIWDETFSGIMTWYAGSTNSTDADEIILHKAGHASNGQSIFLRTIRQSGSSTLKLQIACTTNFNAAKNLTFKFRKMI